MDQLLKAIKIKYNADAGAKWAALRAANTGGLYLQPRKQEQAYPYMTLLLVGGDLNHMMSGSDIVGAVATTRVQLSIFDDDLATVMSIYSLACAAFDATTLVYISDIEVAMLRVGETGPLFVDDTWQVTIDYEAMRAQ